MTLIYRHYLFLMVVFMTKVYFLFKLVSNTGISRISLSILFMRENKQGREKADSIIVNYQ